MITPSRTRTDQDIRKLLQARMYQTLCHQVMRSGLKLACCSLQVIYLAVQMLIGPSELKIIAEVNTANDDLRRALLGQDIPAKLVCDSPGTTAVMPHDILFRPNTSNSSWATGGDSCLPMEAHTACVGMQVHVVFWMLCCMLTAYHLG